MLVRQRIVVWADAQRLMLVRSVLLLQLQQMTLTGEAAAAQSVTP
jgi:hypothetical protein